MNVAGANAWIGEFQTQDMEVEFKRSEQGCTNFDLDVPMILATS
jgi:hypothetical protein